MAAAADSVKRIKEQATCPICHALFRDPVTTECGHSFCRACIARHFQGREVASCPHCRQQLLKIDLRPNRDLKNIAEILRSQAAGKPEEWNLCERHRQPLQLYCKQDQTPICLVCMQAWAHRGHMVVPVEEAVQEYRGKMAEQLKVIESSCGKLDQFVSEIWKHLPENEQDEECQNLARVSEKLRVLKERAESSRQRSEDKDSKPKDSPPKSNFPESESDRTGKQEKTESHVGPVGQKDPTRKHELSQGSLDESFHKISGTRGDAEPKVDAQQTENRPKDGSSLTPAEGSGGSRTEASSVSSEEEGNGAPAGDRKQRNPLLPPTPAPVPEPPHQTEQHSGRKPGSEPKDEKQKETGSPVNEETSTTKQGLSQGSLDDTIDKISDTTGKSEPKVAEKETRKRPKEGSSTTPAEGSGGSRTGAIPASSKQEGAAKSSGTEAAREGQQHPGSKISKNKKRKNKKHR